MRLGKICSLMVLPEIDDPGGLFVSGSHFLPAFVAKNGIAQIFIATVGTEFRSQFILNRMTTARAKFGRRRNVF